MTLQHYQVLSILLAALAVVLINFAAKKRSQLLQEQVADCEKLIYAAKQGNQLLEKQVADYEKKFAPILNAEGEIQRLQSNIITLRTDHQKLRTDYREKKTRYDDLVRAAAIFDEQIEFAELGFYKPHFDFGTSEQFKDKIADVRARQKVMLKAKNAIYCDTSWTVEGSRSKGEIMTNRAIRLTARAFNGECEAAVSNVRWNNISRMEKRIENAFDAINKLNQSINTKISHSYLALKLDELRLTHEYYEKKQQEKEEKAELRRQELEEAKLRKEAAEAAEEEARYAKLLKQAQDEARTATDARLEMLNNKISTLATQLQEAHSKSERALSMAQQTRAGYVYVISNVGSFGDNVYKIGMTRRLDPMDRVKELGDASVPFIFDTHAIMYSQDAPAMEAKLHQAFESKRINKMNNRKEFFRVTLDEVRREVTQLFPDSDFIETIEARDFIETKALENRLEHVRSKSDAINRFPEQL